MLQVRLYTRLHRDGDVPSAAAELESRSCVDWRSTVAYLRELRLAYRIARPLRARMRPVELHLGGWPGARISLWVGVVQAHDERVGAGWDERPLRTHRRRSPGAL